MISRSALREVRTALKLFPVVALLGPRQVGKTTLATTLAASLGKNRTRHLDLESTADRARLADAESYLSAQNGKLVILDEIHRAPALFEILRVIVDRRRRSGARTGQFLVLGSASLDLLRQSSESLAGRIAFVELTPVRIDELPRDAAATPDRLWLRGGFPDSFLAKNDIASHAWRTAFIRTYLERDVPALGPRVPAETLRRLWTMLAHNQGQQLNSARLAAALAVSGQSITRYIDLLVDLLLIRRLSPWGGNVGKRLVKAPKIYLRDSGIAHTLLGIESLDDLLGHPVAGASWEGMVIETLIAAANGAPFWFYRTAAGAEVDLVIEGPRGRRVAVEVKRSSAPSASKGFHNGCEDLAASRAAVIYPGDELFQLGHGVQAVGIRKAAAWLRSALASKSAKNA